MKKTIVLSAFASILLLFILSTPYAAGQQSVTDGWKAGVGGCVAIVEWGVGEDINSVYIKDPIIGFVFSNKGLMYNLTIEGSKFTKLVR